MLTEPAVASPENEVIPAPPAAAAGAKREQILEGARQVFLSAGFDGASMGEIARAAGVSKGTLYVYFDSKEALFEALTISEKSSLAEALFDLDHERTDVRAVLRQLGASFIEHLAKPAHISSVRMVIGAAHRFPQFGRAFYEAGPEIGRRRLGAYLERQVAAGRLEIDDCGVAAQQYLEMCASSVLKKLLFGVEAVAPSRLETNAIVDRALRLFFAAYGPERSRA